MHLGVAQGGSSLWSKSILKRGWKLTGMRGPWCLAVIVLALGCVTGRAFVGEEHS